MRDTHLRLKLQLFNGGLFNAFKKEKAEHKAKSEDDSDEEPEPNVTYVNNLLHSLFSNCDVYFNNTMAYNSLAVSNKRTLACHGYSFGKFPDAFDMHPFID